MLFLRKCWPPRRPTNHSWDLLNRLLGNQPYSRVDNKLIQRYKLQKLLQRHSQRWLQYQVQLHSWQYHVLVFCRFHLGKWPQKSEASKLKYFRVSFFWRTFSVFHKSSSFSEWISNDANFEHLTIWRKKMCCDNCENLNYAYPLNVDFLNTKKFKIFFSAK